MSSAHSVTARSRISTLSGCAAVVEPADPPRLSTVAFWRPDGTPPDGTAAAPPGEPAELTVALPGEDGAAGLRTVPVLRLSVAEALPVLTRARAAASAPGTEPSAAFWGAAALLALQLAARGRLLPGLTATDHDAWRLGPLDPADVDRLRELAEAMPPHARAVPLPGSGTAQLPDPEPLLRTFVNAVADGLPRSPAAALAAGGRAFAAREPQRLPGRRAWAEEIAAGQDAGVRLSLRVEVPGLCGNAAQDARFRAVLQVHSVEGPTAVADAAELWTDAPAATGFGPRARTDALVTLRKAAAAWEPLRPLLNAAVPDCVELADEDVTSLLSPVTGRALAAAGLEVHWPRELVRSLSARAVIGAPPERGTPVGGVSPLSPGALFDFTWRVAVGGQELTAAELDALAESRRPLVRLRDQWVLLDVDELRRARDRKGRTMTGGEALGSVLAGSVEEAGERVEVRAEGALEELRARLAEPEAGAPEHGPVPEPVPQPAALAATLRDYQLRGFNWLHRMTSLGLGACLADDMGLGKTVTVIALHLHRRSVPGAAGPTLVVCPASLLGNWQREIERFAPGSPVRRHHGSGRELEALADGEFVLTTYATMRRDASELAATAWGLVVADEAQHVKNASSATARALRTLPSAARVALSGTPVENNLSELWALVDWTTPGVLGTLPSFRRRFADAVEAGRDPAAAEALGRLIRPFLLRRRKTDPGIAPELPRKTETDRPVSLSAEQAGLYEAVVREGLAAVSGSEGMARRGLVVKLLTSLKQICNHPAQYLKEDPESSGRGRPRLAGRSGKLELFDELLDTLLAEDAATLVFTQYVRLARLLEVHLTARGVPVMLLHGGTPVGRREEMVRRFQAGEVPVFLLSLKAAGTGLNLTRAEHVVHFDRWWNPAVEAQATDRAHRIGQTRPVQVHRLIAEGTIEDRIAELLARKQALADSVLSVGEAALTELSDIELAELIELRGSGA
ncbi:DEAD/DEAH box helicase [Streptomyces sp. WMMC1477]|uniref:DEAD/DEAH box helicase n=1 Tax=Streptomyces sp. WMMC1477 TaxID=3015155 RepID=UPI0022B73928|nr:DEAD/DEAH box helicase [Streptomyces sp. WMMC1477]MCZ7434542.1 DEAD/DEAH box helicase [Streptomyces sp. WMMC1477]